MRLGFNNIAQQQYTYAYGQNRRNDFITALLILIAEVMKANGHVKRTELNYVKQKLILLFGYDTAAKAILQLRDILKQNYNIYQVSEIINRNVDYDSKIEILHILYGIAEADGEVSDSEIQLIRQIAYNIGINIADAESIFNTVTNNSSSLDDAYKILGIAPQSTEDEIKKAYRSLVLKYHPDRVAELGEEVQKNAEARFRKVQEAYDKIKLARNIK